MAQIDCHIIFTESMDREDWLERCVASLEHPDVVVHVHRFANADEQATPRRVRIHNANDPERWCMFADPDDYAVESGYSSFIEHLKTFEGDVTHPQEMWEPAGTVCSRPHHLVATRGLRVPEDLSSTFNFYFDRESVLFPQVAYAWVEHGQNSRGGKKWRA